MELNDEIKLPPLLTNPDIFDRFSKTSETVLVRVKGFREPTTGRYSYEAKAWTVNNFTGNPEVVEWWPLPENGTGFKPQ